MTPASRPATAQSVDQLVDQFEEESPSADHSLRVESPIASPGWPSLPEEAESEGLEDAEIEADSIAVVATGDWAWLLWTRRRFLARAVLTGFAFSLVTAALIPNRYDSTVRLMPPDGQSGSGIAMLAAMAGKSGMGLGSMAGDLLGMRSSGALFAEILRSRTVEDGIVGRFDLRRVYRDRYWVDARKDLSAYTEISEDRKSEVITIRVTDRDPRRAAQIAQAYVDQLDRLVAEVSTSSARRERIFIEDRLNGVKGELDRASREFSQFASQNATLDISTQGKAMVEAAARLQGELIGSQSELQGLEQVYTPNNVRVRSLRARVNELRKQLDKLDGASLAPPALAGAPPPLTESGRPGSGFPSIRELPLLGVRWAELFRQTKIEETVYELLTQEYEMAKIEEAKEIPTVKILDAADVPERKSTPHRTTIVVLGMLLSLSAATLWVLAQATWKQIDPLDPRKALALQIWRRIEIRANTIPRRWNGWSRRHPKAVST